MVPFANRKISWQRYCVLIGSVAAIGIVAVWLYRVRNPPELVKVTFRNAPADAMHAAVVFDIDGNLQSVLFEFDLRSPGPLISADKFIRWKDAKRYGVAIERVDESWSITWFEPAQVPIIGRNFLIGGGGVDFDLAGGRTESLPTEEVKRLGLFWG